MSRLRRMPYTKPIPPGASIVTHKGRPHARFQKDGKSVLAPLTENGERIALRTKKWYGEYRDANGDLQCVPLTANKVAAGQMLAELVRKAEFSKAGLLDPFERHCLRPLTEHLADWEATMYANPNSSAKHVRQTVACARRVIEGCRFVFLADLSASAVQHFLADLRKSPTLPSLDAAKTDFTKAELAAALGVKASAVTALVRRHRLPAHGRGKARRFPRSTVEALRQLRCRGCSIKTSNLHLAAAKQFTSWLVDDRRTADNVLSRLAGGNVELDKRHLRRKLSADEINAIIDAAAASNRSYRGLAGADRAMLYKVAVATGFRAEELSCLCPRAFNLAARPPVARLNADQTKNGKAVDQPMSDETAEELGSYLKTKPADGEVWPGAWFRNAADMLRIDLDAAGIPYRVESSAGPLYADFHSLRHSFIALLDNSGATLKEAMQLARHSDPKLTMAVYGRGTLSDLGAVANRANKLLATAKREATIAATTTGHPSGNAPTN